MSSQSNLDKVLPTSPKSVNPAYVAFGVAAVWFGCHCGGGFATGNQEVNFFVKYGWPSLFIPFFAIVLLAWGYRNSLVLAKDNQTYDYRSFAEALYHPYDKIFANIYELGFIILTLVGPSAAIAGAAALLNQSLGVPYFFAIVIIGVVLLFMTIFGAELIIKASEYMTYFLVGSLLLVAILGIKAGAFNFVNIIATRETFDTNIWAAIWKGLIYVGFQCFTMVPVIACAQGLKTTKQCNQFMGYGLLLNGGLLVLVCIMLLGFSPAVLKETLPVYYVTQQLGGFAWLEILYSLILFIALVSTAITMVFGVVTRFKDVKLINKKEGFLSKEQNRKILISAITICICTSMSVFGLTTLVTKGYGSLGYIGLFFVLPALLFVAGMKNKKAAEERKRLGIVEG